MNLPDAATHRDTARSPCCTLRGVAYWTLAALLVLYVALCTGNRDIVPDADAWEHHRVVRALTLDLHHPGNPTFASDAPSIRFSPYYLAQAVVCRSFSVDPYRALSVAAVINTILFFVGLWFLLRVWDEVRAAPLVLICAIGLWGVAPGYAGTTALADLPWHQVNPSAFSFALCLFVLALTRQAIVRGGLWRWPLIAVLSAVATLDHPMDGAFLAVALLLNVWFAPAQRRKAAFAGVVGVGLFMLVCCLAWPYYSFLTALRTRLDTAYWFNGAIVRLMLFRWCMPAMVLALAALAALERPLVRASLAIGTAGLLLTLASIPTSSPTFARLLMPATLMFHIAIAIWADRNGALCCCTWRNVIRDLVHARREPTRVAPAALMAIFAIALLYGLVPQVIAVASEPYLARPLVTMALSPIKEFEDKQHHLKPIYDALLDGIGEHDVVLADTLTSWPIPSSRGRVVTALHYERFITDQAQRDADAATFFAADTDEATRRAIAEHYNVRWIVLNLDTQPERTAQWLLSQCREVRRVGDLVLLDASPLRSE